VAGRLDGKAAIVTGATAGIGAAIARRFCDEGASVLVTGRDRIRGENLVAQLGSNARFCVADLTSEGGPSAVLEAAESNTVE